MQRSQVLILTEILAHYRRPFFERLRIELGADGIDLVLVYGQPYGDEATKDHTVDVSWAHKVQNRNLPLGKQRLCWQPALSFAKNADLVIAEQASRLLMNYVLFGTQRLGLKNMAFWGHGKNFSTDASRVGEAVKRWMSRNVHWWFAYNDASAKVVEDLGFPRHRITSVQNAIDTRALVEARAAVDATTLHRLRADFSLKGTHTCLYIGGMYAEKRLAFLLDACHRIRKQVPNFEMLFIGDGPDAPLVQEATRHYPWLHYVGVKLGTEAVPYFALSKLLLMPGLVGLAILDALSMKVPLITTDVPFHSPEINYLRDGENGVILQEADDAQAYADAVVGLLQNEGKRQHLIAGCRQDAHHYTIENMVQRFAEGVRQALSTP